MINPRFEKEAFKKEVEQNVKQLFRKTVDEVSQQELYQAVSYVVKDAIIDDWIATQKQYEKDDPKIVYYMSMEFLLGRALGNNLINMTAYKEVTWTSRCMFPGFTGISWLCGLRLWYPLPLWYVQAEDQRWLSGRKTG